MKREKLKNEKYSQAEIGLTVGRSEVNTVENEKYMK